MTIADKNSCEKKKEKKKKKRLRKNVHVGKDTGNLDQRNLSKLTN